VKVPSFTPYHVCCLEEYVIHQLWQVLTSIRLFIVWSFLGFLLRTPLVMSSCGRF